MAVDTRNSRKALIRCLGFAIIASLLVVAAVCQDVAAAETKQVVHKMFRSPEEAVKAFTDAIEADDLKELMMIFGPGAKEVIFSGDEVADKAGREHFAKSYGEMNKLVPEDDGKVVLHVGSDDWPFPIPIVKKGKAWFFDTEAGKHEILHRRIGRNELSTIQVCLAYVDAQREYASTDWDGNGLFEYAQTFASTKGAKDGLYWETKGGGGGSPLGPLAAEAVEEGSDRDKSGIKPVPYHGYFFKILKSQGKHAPGGAYDYVVKGKMIGGFGLVAYPAGYAVSGVMTFIVSHDGVVYQKDLGRETEKVVKGMKQYDPDKTWKKVE
jgi:hypothetical protein